MDKEDGEAANDSHEVASHEDCYEVANNENEKDSHEGSHEDGEAAKGSHEKASHDRKKEKEVSGLFVLG